jgi:hypothetical protein
VGHSGGRAHYAVTQAPFFQTFPDMLYPSFPSLFLGYSFVLQDTSITDPKTCFVIAFFVNRISIHRSVASFDHSIKFSSNPNTAFHQPPNHATQAT